MKKAFKVEGINCANCAEKISREIENLEGVNSANLSFMFQKLTLDVEEGCLESVVEKSKAICDKIEPGCKILV